MEQLGRLCCGNFQSVGRLEGVISILNNAITRHGEKALQIIRGGAEDEISMYGSFVVRKLQESALSAILARMDPARFLILHEYQQRAGTGYKAHERHPASIAWAGDIIPEKAANSIWGNESSPEKFGRSLLGGHLAEVAWPMAIDMFAHDSLDSSMSVWVEDIRRTYEEKSQGTPRANEDEVAGSGAQSRPFGSGANVGLAVLEVFRNRCQHTYSALSKGVHLEFVVDETVVLDPETVMENMLTAVKLVSQMGFLSHYMDAVFTKVEPNAAFELILNVEESFRQ